MLPDQLAPKGGRYQAAGKVVESHQTIITHIIQGKLRAFSHTWPSQLEPSFANTNRKLPILLPR